MTKQKRFQVTGIIITSVISLLLTFIACDFEPTVIFDSAKSGDITLPFLTKAEIRQMLEETDAKHLPSSVMEYDPDYNPTDSNSPWNPGKVKQEALDLALARINVIRRICGLHPMIAQEEGNKSAQYGAALMAITQTVGHGNQPEWPGIDSASIQKGKAATNAGNIFQLPPPRIIYAMDGYCLDNGNPTVGHRLLLLEPGQQQIGIGTAPPPPTGGWGANVVQIYSLPELPKDYVRKEFDWDFVSYPSAGYFPLLSSLFGTPSLWTIKLNTAKYEIDTNAVQVVVTRLKDKQTWNFNWKNGHTGASNVFQLENNTVKPGDVFKVELKGLKDKSGNPVDFAFQTEFFAP